MIVALETMIDRLKEDHENAKYLYHALKDIPNLIIEEPETNIIFLGLDNLPIDAMEVSKRLAKENILVYGGYGERTRLVLNRMVNHEDTIRVSEILNEMLSSL